MTSSVQRKFRLITQRSEVQILPRNQGRLNKPPFLLQLRGRPYSGSCKMLCENLSEENHAHARPCLNRNDFSLPQALLDAKPAPLEVHMLPLKSKQLAQAKTRQSHRRKQHAGLVGKPTRPVSASLLLSLVALASTGTVSSRHFSPPPASRFAESHPSRLPIRST